MTTITVRIPAPEMAKSTERQLRATIENNPRAAGLAAILAGSIDVLKESGQPEDSFTRFLAAVVQVCDTVPHAELSMDPETITIEPGQLKFPQEALDAVKRTGQTAPVLHEWEHALTVGPDDVLVVLMPKGTPPDVLNETRHRILEMTSLDSPRILLIEGADQLAVVKK